LFLADSVVSSFLFVPINFYQTSAPLPALLCLVPLFATPTHHAHVYIPTPFSPTTFRPFPSSLLFCLLPSRSYSPLRFVCILLHKASLIVAGIEEPIPSTSSLAFSPRTHQTLRNLHHVSSYRRGRIGQSHQRCGEERGFATSQVYDAYR
jgi:hypothetical protein